MKVRVDFSSYLISLYPVSWILGISAVYLHAVILMGAFLKLSRKSLLNVPRPVVFLIFYTIIYFLSLVLNYGNYSLDRAIASLYNLSFWLIGILLILLVFHNFNLDIERLKKQSKFILTAIATVGVFVLLSKNEPLIIRSLLGHMLNVDSFPQLVRDSIHLKIMSKDWFDGAQSVRNALFSPYSTATAALSLMLFGIITIGERVASLRFCFWVLLCFVAILSTYSRLVTVLFVFYVLLLIILNTKQKVLLTVSAVMMVLLLIPFLYDFFVIVNQMRQGSSNIRFSMYQQTILHTFENNILFGVAVKDRGFYFIPLGSHSTYLGALLKTGLLGVTSLILFSAYFWKRFFSEMFKENSSPISRSLSPLLLLMTLFWAFEDIDAAQFLSVIYFLIVGIYLKGDKG